MLLNPRRGKCDSLFVIFTIYSTDHKLFPFGKLGLSTQVLLKPSRCHELQIFFTWFVSLFPFIKQNKQKNQKRNGWCLQSSFWNCHFLSISCKLKSKNKSLSLITFFVASKRLSSHRTLYFFRIWWHLQSSVRP